MVRRPSTERRKRDGPDGGATRPTPGDVAWPDGSPHDDLDRALVASFRAHSLESQFYLQAVADRLDMTTADFACLTLLLLEGACTAGRLAERTGLTTGAITGVVDRLERQGRVRRGVDPADRRRVIVEPNRERARDLAEVLGPMVADARRLHAQFSRDELAHVLRFVDQARAMLASNTARLRSAEALLRQADGVVSVPRGAQNRAVLHLAGLASRMRVHAGDLGDALCRVDFGGAAPTVRAWPGHVVVQLRGRARAAARGEILISADVVWDVTINGGCSFLDVDLRHARLSGLTLRGGARRLELQLPLPEGVVPVRVMGGASRIVVRRPADVPVGVRIRGGASEVVVDGTRVRPGPGGARFPASATAGPAGYEVELFGGASRLVVEPQ